MRVTVDSSRCQGHALCVMFGPEFFSLDEYGHSTVADPMVDAALEEAVLAAAARCPEQAILVDAHGGLTGEISRVPSRRGTRP